MGGSAEKVLTYGGVTKPLWNAVGMFEDKKKKGDGLSPQARKNLAAKSAQPLLQQTALTPEQPKATGAGASLL